MEGPTKSYRTLIDEQIKRQQEIEKQGRGYYPLRPSSAGYCARKLAYELAAYEGIAPKEHENRDPHITRLLSLGHTLERHVLRYLEAVPSTKVTFTQQVVEMFTLPSGRIVEGSTDAVVYHVESKGLLDVKTMGDKFSSWRDSKWEELAATYDRSPHFKEFDEYAWYIEDVEAALAKLPETDSLHQNIPQINMYACTEFLQKRGINHAVVFRYNKNNSKLMEIRFKPSMSLFEKSRAKYTAIENAVLVDKDPEKVVREHVLGSQACAFCPYSKRCWGEDSNGRKSYFATWPKKDWPRDTDRMERGQEVEELIAEWERLKGEEAECARVETAILKVLQESQEGKVRLANGDIYEVKDLVKGPELRRSKL